MHHQELKSALKVCLLSGQNILLLALLRLLDYMQDLLKQHPMLRQVSLKSPSSISLEPR